VRKFSPTAKILLYILLIATVFLSDSIKIDFTLLVVVFLCASGVTLSILTRGFVPILLFLGFTFFSNTLFHTGRVVYELAGFTITEEGLMSGIHLTLRLFILILGAKILTATTSADDLVHGMARLLGPFGRWKPVQEFTSTLSLTLSFLPLIYNEARTLYTETFKNSRTKNLLEKIKLAVALIIPLLERSMKKARELSEKKL
jgi:energy-coupling factor transporter transmembrane protein EcfT